MSYFFDNNNGYFLKNLRGKLNTASHVDFCVGYFNLGGWGLIDDAIEELIYRGGTCRLLVGIPESSTIKSFYEQSVKNMNLYECKQISRRFAEQLQTKKLTIKIDSRKKIHSKFYIFHEDLSNNATTAFFGSSNLTKYGLQLREDELNTVFNCQIQCNDLKIRFENYWNHSRMKDISVELSRTILDNAYSR